MSCDVYDSSTALLIKMTYSRRRVKGYNLLKTLTSQTFNLEFSVKVTSQYLL
jgi:hypothetical protein